MNIIPFNVNPSVVHQHLDINLSVTRDIETAAKHFEFAGLFLQYDSEFLAAMWCETVGEA